MNIKKVVVIALTIFLVSGFYFFLKPKEEKLDLYSDTTTVTPKLDYVPGEVIHPESHHNDSKNKIAMRYAGFEPSETMVEEGTMVVFRNEELRDRWPASDSHPTHNNYPEFDAKAPVKSAEVWIFKFTQVGEWKFHDHLFPNFKGVVKVVKKGQLPKEPSIFNIAIQEKKIMSAFDTLHVYQGEDVTINITSDENEELYLSGYEKTALLTPGKTSTIKFAANVSGKFKLQLRRSDTELGSLVVEKQE